MGTATASRNQVIVKATEQDDSINEVVEGAEEALEEELQPTVPPPQGRKAGARRKILPAALDGSVEAQAPQPPAASGVRSSSTAAGMGSQISKEVRKRGKTIASDTAVEAQVAAVVVDTAAAGIAPKPKTARRNTKPDASDMNVEANADSLPSAKTRAPKEPSTAGREKRTPLSATKPPEEPSVPPKPQATVRRGKTVPVSASKIAEEANAHDLQPAASGRRKRGPVGAVQEVTEEPSPVKSTAAVRKRAKVNVTALTAAEAPEGGAAVAVTATEMTSKPSPGTKRPKKVVAVVEKVYYSPLMRPPPLHDGVYRILTWNVAGLRGLLKKVPNIFPDLIEREQPDLICLQETKLQAGHVQDVQETLRLPAGWTVHWECCRGKPGYSGVAVMTKDGNVTVSAGLGVEGHDEEGRLMTVDTPVATVINVYVPNSGEGLRRLDYRVQDGGWDDSLRKYIVSLASRGKPVVVTGDMNCAVEEIDIHNPKGNLRSAGFTQEERDSFSSRYLTSGLLVDSFRTLHRDIVAYTYYTYKFNCREKNKGWRLDYFLVSPSLMPSVYESFIMSDVRGSDHIPIGLTIKKQ